MVDRREEDVTVRGVAEATEEGDLLPLRPAGVAVLDAKDVALEEAAGLSQEEKKSSSSALGVSSDDLTASMPSTKMRSGKLGPYSVFR